MARLLGHRQTKGAATDKPRLRPPRHISTLPSPAMTETGISHSTSPVLTTIPIAVIPIIDAGTASLSPFQQTIKIVHDHAGIGVHVRPEWAFTMRWKPRSRSTGICKEIDLIEFIRWITGGFDDSTGEMCRQDKLVALPEFLLWLPEFRCSDIRARRHNLVFVGTFQVIDY
jgi:hypothetical protein